MEEYVSPEVSQGSLDLQSNVLPLSYRPLMEAFVFPFLFLEVSLALGAINGYGKNKKAMLFTTPNLECCSPSSKRRKNRRRRGYGGDGWLCVFGHMGGIGWGRDVEFLKVSGCMGVSGKWKTEGMSVYWE